MYPPTKWTLPVKVYTMMTIPRLFPMVVLLTTQSLVFSPPGVTQIQIMHADDRWVDSYPYIEQVDSTAKAERQEYTIERDYTVPNQQAISIPESKEHIHR